MIKKVVTDLTRGGLFVAGSAVVVASVLAAIVFLGSAIVAVILYEEAGIALLAYFGAIAAGILLVPIMLIVLGRWLHE